MSDQVVEREINPDGAMFAYHALIDALESHEPFDAVVAAITFIGVQYNGKIMPEAEMSAYTKNICEWLAMYFAKGREQ